MYINFINHQRPDKFALRLLIWQLRAATCRKCVELRNSISQKELLSILVSEIAFLLRLYAEIRV